MITAISVISMAIQVASPFSQFDIMSEKISDNTLVGYSPANDRGCCYTYSRTSDAIQVIKNLQYEIPNQQYYPAFSISNINGDFTRPLPLNFDSSNMSVKDARQLYIDESLMYSTSGLNTCVVMPLQLGLSSPKYIPSQMGIRNKNFDFYCEIKSYGGADVSDGLKAFVIIGSQFYSYTSAFNYALNSSNSIEMNIDYLGVDENGLYTYSISGYINSNSTFFDNSLWTNNSSRIMLVVYNEKVSNFGSYGMGSLTFIFPNNNCCTWEKIWENGYIAPTESSIFDAIMHSDLETFITTAIDIIPIMGSEFAFWLTPMGYIISIQQFEIILGLALIFIVVEKFAI